MAKSNFALWNVLYCFSQIFWICSLLNPWIWNLWGWNSWIYRAHCARYYLTFFFHCIISFLFLCNPHDTILYRDLYSFVFVSFFSRAREQCNSVPCWSALRWQSLIFISMDYGYLVRFLQRELGKFLGHQGRVYWNFKPCFFSFHFLGVAGAGAVNQCISYSIKQITYCLSCFCFLWLV